MESLLVSLLVLGIICVGVWYVSTLLPQPVQKILQVLVVVGAVVWLLTHVRTIISVIAGS